MTLFVLALIAVLTGCVAQIAFEALRAPRRAWPGVSLWSAMLLAAAVVLAVWLRTWVVPAHHAMYLDEPWYAEAACNLSTSGELRLCEETWSGRRCAPYGKAVGWPAILSIGTWLVGCDSSIGIEISRVLGVATVPLVALAAVGAGASLWQGAVGAVILALHPIHIEWSTTGETNIAAAFFTLLAISGVLFYRRRGFHFDAVLTVTATAIAIATAIATAIRPEILAVALGIAATLASSATIPASRRAVLAASIILVSGIAASSAAPLWTMNEAISGGGFLSSANVLPSLGLVIQDGGWRIHGIVGILALFGIGTIARSGDKTTALLFLTAAMAAVVPVLAYERFAARMVLVATAILVPLCGVGLPWLPTRGRLSGSPSMLEVGVGLTILVAVAIAWEGPIRSAATVSETQLLETRMVEALADRALAPDALLIAEQPTVLAAAGFHRVMRTSTALADRARVARTIEHGTPVYFLSDMFCEAGFQGGGAAGRCRDLLAGFKSREVVTERLHSRRYVLYALDGAH